MRRDDVEVEQLPKRIGKHDTAVGALVVLDNRDERTARGDRSAVQRVGEYLPAAGVAITNAEAPRLIVGAIARARHFAPLAAATASWHPSFEIELAIRGSAEIAGRVFHDAKWDPQAVENLFFDLEQVKVHLIAELHRREREHLDFRELVDAVEPSGRAPVRAGLGAEAMAHAGELERQLGGVERDVRIEAAQSDFRGSDQARDRSTRLYKSASRCLGADPVPLMIDMRATSGVATSSKLLAWSTDNAYRCNARSSSTA